MEGQREGGGWGERHTETETEGERQQGGSERQRRREGGELGGRDREKGWVVKRGGREGRGGGSWRERGNE